MEALDGISLTAGGAAVGTVATCLVQMWKARHQRTEIAPQPLAVEPSPAESRWAGNARDHTDIFARLRSVEADLAANRQVVVSLNDTQKQILHMVQSLYEKICIPRG